MSTILYLIGEAFINLRRNVLVATGAVLAVFVSLALAFGALVFNELVRVNTLQWQAGDHLIIFLKDEGGPVAHNDLLEQIQGYEEVERAWYLDKAGAYQEFQEMYSDQPALVGTVSAADLPASIRVELKDVSAYQEVQFRLVGHPLLRRLSVFSEGIERLMSLTQVLNSIGVGLVAILGAAAVVLIANTIRMAIYARREEIAIMKLVGAGNWFIRVPFILEGITVGLLGGALAVAAVYGSHNLLARIPTDILIRFQVESDFLFSRGVMILCFGAIAGFVGSSLGLRRFLRV